MRFRWTIKDLREYSDYRFLRGLVAERMSDCTNIYAPLYQRLQKVYNKLDRNIEKNLDD